MRALRPAHQAAFLVGRLLFGGFFLVAASNHALNTQGLTAAAAAQGVPYPFIAVVGTGLLLLLGGLGVTFGVFPRVALGFLILFLVGVTPMMHAFWAISDPATRMAQMAFFMRNIALLGASLSLMAVPTPWPWSLSRAIQGPERTLTRQRPQA